MYRKVLLQISILLGIYGCSTIPKDFTEKEWIYLPNHTDGQSFPLILSFANDSLRFYSFGSNKVLSKGCPSGYMNCIDNTDTTLINKEGDRLHVKWNNEDFHFVPLDSIIPQVNRPSTISMDSIKNQTFDYSFEGFEGFQIVFLDTLYDKGIVGPEYRDFVKSYFILEKENDALSHFDDGTWAIHERSGLKVLILEGMMSPTSWYIQKTVDETGLHLLTSDQSGISDIHLQRITESEAIDLGMLQDSKWLLSDYQELPNNDFKISSIFKEPDSPNPLSVSDLKEASIELQFTSQGKYELIRDGQLLDFGSWRRTPDHPDLIQIITGNDFQVAGIQFCRIIDIQSLTMHELKFYTELGVADKNGIDHVPMLLTLKRK